MAQPPAFLRKGSSQSPGQRAATRGGGAPVEDEKTEGPSVKAALDTISEEVGEMTVGKTQAQAALKTLRAALGDDGSQSQTGARPVSPGQKAARSAA